jgi:hypothetical protein
VVGVADAHPLGHTPHGVVGRGDERVDRDAEHSAGLVVERVQLILPVGDVPPLPVGEERTGRPVEGVGVHQRTAADARAGQHHDAAGLGAADEVHALHAGQAERRRPQVAGDPPVGLRQPGVARAGRAVPSGVEAAARLDHADLVALLGQPERRDAAAEARPDDQYVVVVRARRHGPRPT